MTTFAAAVLLMFFRGLGYKPICVENGLECLKLAQTRAFDMIFMDIDMPEMTGIECTRELRREGLDIFIVAVTASSVPNPEILPPQRNERLHSKALQRRRPESGVTRSIRSYQAP